MNRSSDFRFETVLLVFSSQPVRTSTVSIEFRNIRFDVQKRGAVENVNALDVQQAVFDLVQLNNGKPDWVRTLGRTSGKESPRFRIHERHNVEVESVASVKVVKQDDVRETVEILKSWMEILEHLNSTLYAGGSRRLDRHAFRFHKWGVDNPYRFEFDFHFSPEC